MSKSASSSTSSQQQPTNADMEDFEWDPSTATATAWSKASRQHRVRGAFGGRGASRRAFRMKKAATLSREKSSESSGYLAESSPEGSNHSIKNSLTEENLSSLAKNTENLVNTVATSTLERSTSLIALPPKPIRQSRSFSLSTVSGFRDSSTSSSTATTEEFSFGFSEWPDTNAGDLEMRGDQHRERKKIRARICSIQGSVAPLSETSSFSHLARSAEDWKRIEEQSPSQKAIDFGQLNNNELSSPPGSVASSRKRGVGGSPFFSDQDDMSSSGNISLSQHSSSSLSGRRTRSRSRIFSPGATPAPTPFSFPALGPAPGRSSPDDNISRNIMDIDSDDGDDEEEEESNTSPDSSFETESSRHHHSMFDKAAGNADKSMLVVENEQDVLETMSSYNDLKFIIVALRKEQKKQLVAFGTSDSWTVAPKQSWPPSRRSAFFQWTTLHLGFTVRAVGGSVNCLQISKTKGTIILSKLEAGLVAYKQKELGQLKEARQATVEESFSFMDMSYSARKIPPVVKSLHATSDTINPARRILEGIQLPGDEAADDLAAGLESLTVEDKPKKSVSSMVRLVTLDTSNNNNNNNNDSDSRPSIDNHVGTKDMMLHLHGQSPVITDSLDDKQIRMSLASVQSAGTYNSNRVSAPFAINAAPSFEIVETPLMKQEENWGSCPVQGRDWGESCRCEDAVLQELIARFDESGRDAGARDSFGVLIGGMQPGATCRSSLQFDIEPDTVEMQIVETSKDAEKSQVTFQDVGEIDERVLRRRKKSYAKHKRISVFISASQPSEHVLPQPHGLFRENKSLGRLDENIATTLERFPCDATDTEVEEKHLVASNEAALSEVFSFLTESEILSKASLVCSSWANAATTAHANLMLASVGYTDDDDAEDDDDYDDESTSDETILMNPIAKSMEVSWAHLNNRFPWGRFLSEGAFKKVYKVFNAAVGAEEAVSVMDVEKIVDKKTIAAELAVSSMLSSLARRGICPNFVLTRGVFTCPYDPPATHWGSSDNKRPQGDKYVKGAKRKPREPTVAFPGRFQYIRMELCDEGDAEEFVKRQPNEILPPNIAQAILFQMAFALHAAAERFSVKHYDVKLLNIFINRSKAALGDVVLRYGLGSHVFALRMPAEQAAIAKLADYGTANIKASTNGQPVTIAQFTTLENTPADHIILGDEATQGHGHDCFGLGLCMLHLFTGHAPYEEILEDVQCPTNLKKKLRKILEDDNVDGYDVIRSVILSDVYKDEAGHIIEGEPDETIYDTLYRFIVLFGIPEEKFQQKRCPKVWKAIADSLEAAPVGKSKGGKPARRKNGLDATQYNRHRRKYSIRSGTNKYIARARTQLETMEGGIDLLFSLCSFDPTKRASAMDVLNSDFMANLRETPEGAISYGDEDTVHSYMAFSTHR